MNEYQFCEERLFKGFGELSLIPSYMRDGIKLYVLQGIPMGGFGGKLLSNDLMGALGHADDNNQRAIMDWARLLYNYVPRSCWGSPENYKNWISSGGIAGQMKARESEGA
jgi:hypothetical protein